MRGPWLFVVLVACGGEGSEGTTGADGEGVPTAPGVDPYDVAPPDPTGSWTEEPPAQAEPWFESSFDGAVRATDEGSYRVDSAHDLMLSAELADGGDLDLFVIGTVDGPGSYAVTDVQYYRYDDPFSAIGTWSRDDDPGSMSLVIEAIYDDGLMEARWSGSVVMQGIESSGSSATWSVGSGWVVDWPGSGLDDARSGGGSASSR